MGKSKSNAPAVYGGQGVAGFVPMLKPSQPATAAVGKPLRTESAGGTAAAYARMMADPLNAPVVGRPDSNNMATNVSRVRDVYECQTAASGVFAVGFSAAVVNGVGGAVYTGSDASFVAPQYSPSQYAAQIAADNYGIRTLAYVVEWMPTLSENSLAGRVCLSHYPVDGISSLPGGNVATYFDDDSLDFPAAKSGCTVVRPWLDNQFKPPGGAQDFLATVVIAGSGFPAVVQTVGQLVVTRIIEQLPKGTVLARHGATHTVCDPGACCQANNLVGRAVTFAASSNASRDLMQNGLKMLAQIVKRVKPYVQGALEMGALMM